MNTKETKLMTKDEIINYNSCIRFMMNTWFGNTSEEAMLKKYNELKKQLIKI